MSDSITISIPKKFFFVGIIGLVVVGAFFFLFYNGQNSDTKGISNEITASSANALSVIVAAAAAVSLVFSVASIVSFVPSIVEPVSFISTVMTAPVGAVSTFARTSVNVIA